ncbi:hypothetical protein ACIPPM_06090 [Streptomyces sp. NPDC090119]|uniref:hypothetical protein n=1 Tax=Streptomyces sp. NPDC090119 TaxID=3365951 RepID=UPI0038210029
MTIEAGASGASRNAVRISADTVGYVSPVSDVAVTGNVVTGGGFHWSRGNRCPHRVIRG